MKWEKDIYFQTEYGELYENSELGKMQKFELDINEGKILHLFIMRRIPNDSPNEYYDIRTPYGYGGPLITAVGGNRSKLIKHFHKAFREYCYENHIVSEFIRFHPIAGNALDFSKIYDICYNRKTVATNLQISDCPIEDEFSSKCRKNIRRALNKGITYQVIGNPDTLADFKQIYYETMDRNNAEVYYYFDDIYFEELLTKFSHQIVVINAIYENCIIASNLCLISDDIVYIHLSGTLREYLSLSPAYVLRYALTEWAISKGLKYVFHGGGRGNGENDTLYLFKKQFGLHTSFDFYIAEKIWDSEGYKIAYKDKLENETANDYIRRMF